MDIEALVQPIVLRATGTHENAVEAAARASVSAFPGEPTDMWVRWLSGRFTKSVRRAKPALFARLADEFGATIVDVGDAAAFALSPRAYAEFGPLAKLQVSGTSLPRELGCDVVDEGWHGIIVNDDLSMTTGKEAAQVAHGMWVDAMSTDDWSGNVPIARVNAEDFERLSHSGRVILDAALTEFDRPTRTVAVI